MARKRYQPEDTGDFRREDGGGEARHRRTPLWLPQLLQKQPHAQVVAAQSAHVFNQDLPHCGGIDRREDTHPRRPLEGHRGAGEHGRIGRRPLQMGHRHPYPNPQKSLPVLPRLWYIFSPQSAQYRTPVSGFGSPPMRSRTRLVSRRRGIYRACPRKILIATGGGGKGEPQKTVKGQAAAGGNRRRRCAPGHAWFPADAERHSMFPRQRWRGGCP